MRYLYSLHDNSENLGNILTLSDTHTVHVAHVSWRMVYTALKWLCVYVYQQGVGVGKGPVYLSASHSVWLPGCSTTWSHTDWQRLGRRHQGQWWVGSRSANYRIQSTIRYRIEDLYIYLHCNLSVILDFNYICSAPTVTYKQLLKGSEATSKQRYDTFMRWIKTCKTVEVFICTYSGTWQWRTRRLLLLGESTMHFSELQIGMIYSHTHWVIHNPRGLSRFQCRRNEKVLQHRYQVASWKDHD